VPCCATSTTRTARCPSSSTTARKYVWGLDLEFTVDGAGTAEFVHTDGLGSVRALTSAASTVTQTYLSDAFGVPIAGGTAGASTQPFRFAGEQWDGEAGLVYLRARHYAAALGRFTQRDPAPCERQRGGNAYAYARNNPVNLSDPSGLGVGPEACVYYDNRCASAGLSDRYARVAGDCCRSFGEGEAQNCVRQCLIDQDSAVCSYVQPEAARDVCRAASHGNCYGGCGFVPVTGLPSECLLLIVESLVPF
jgi:RHS repeat-associated protein